MGSGNGDSGDKLLGFIIGASIVGVGVFVLARVMIFMAVFMGVLAIVGGLTAGLALGLRSAWKSYKKRNEEDARRREEEARKYEAPSLAAEVEAGSPIDALTAKAVGGSKIAQGLIDQYAALEATALRNGESIEVLRSKFMQGFKAMDDLLTVSADVQKNPSAYDDSESIHSLVLKGEQGLRDKMADEAKQLNVKNVLKAQASAAYLTSSN